MNGLCKVNGLDMYYEIHGDGKPVLLIHGGGSTIDSSFGRLIPLLARRYKIIAMELQAHGRTADRDRPSTFEQDADDIAALMDGLKITSADVVGFSNGGHTAIELALRHPQKMGKIVLASTFISRDAIGKDFWEGFNGARLESMPHALQNAFLKVNDDKTALQRMFDQDVQRMKLFKGWPDETFAKIHHRTLVMNATNDVCTIEHAVKMYRLLDDSELVILPGFHGGYLGALEVSDGREWKQSYGADIIASFLN